MQIKHESSSSSSGTSSRREEGCELCKEEFPAGCRFGGRELSGEVEHVGGWFKCFGRIKLMSFRVWWGGMGRVGDVGWGLKGEEQMYWGEMLEGVQGKG